jgi:hypothetical protein
MKYSVMGCNGRMPAPSPPAEPAPQEPEADLDEDDMEEFADLNM